MLDHIKRVCCVIVMAEDRVGSCEHRGTTVYQVLKERVSVITHEEGMFDVRSCHKGDSGCGCALYREGAS